MNIMVVETNFAFLGNLFLWGRICTGRLFDWTPAVARVAIRTVSHR